MFPAPPRDDQQQGPLFAFLADLWEQVEIMRGTTNDPVADEILVELQRRIEGLAVLSQVAASSVAATE